jgi:hypothetical protein
MNNHLAMAGQAQERKLIRFGQLTERPACFEIDPRRRAVKRAYRIWVSAAAHHCEQRRIDLLFTMSDNLHRADRNQRDTNSYTWTSIRQPPRTIRRKGFAPSGLRAEAAKSGGARRDRTDDLLLAKQALSQLSYGPGCKRVGIPIRKSRA